VRGPCINKSRIISKDHLSPSTSKAELIGHTERQSTFSSLLFTMQFFFVEFLPYAQSALKIISSIRFK